MNKNLLKEAADVESWFEDVDELHDECPNCRANISRDSVLGQDFDKAVRETAVVFPIERRLVEKMFCFGCEMYFAHESEASHEQAIRSLKDDLTVEEIWQGLKSVAEKS